MLGMMQNILPMVEYWRFMSTIPVSVTHLSKLYLLYDRPQDRLKQTILGRLGYNFAKTFWALQNISFEMQAGEVLGIVGRNGSGKSTLLQIVAGILQPTNGQVQINGRLAALLELGSGFNPEFTGRENIILNGSILGLSEKEMRSRLDDITEFAQIGQFIDQPVKLYSSGMFVRLAFAIATSVDPQVLLIDEALAVGDAYFQQKCYRRMQEFKRQGKSILFVSHDSGAIKSLCDRALWLEQGQMREIGKPESVISSYLAYLFGYGDSPISSQATSHSISPSSLEGPNLSETSYQPETNIPNINRRFGNGHAQITGIGLYDEDGFPIASVLQAQSIQIRVSVRYLAEVKSPVFGYILRNRNGLDIASTNTDMEHVSLPPGQPEKVQTLRFIVQIPVLAHGAYTLTIGISDGDYLDYTMCDCIEEILSFDVLPDNVVYALMRFSTKIVIEGEPQ
jgi:ABC-type polysaccharide/polyol phosphate transport system ATPase subunit